jgi:hypothetical protein
MAFDSRIDTSDHIRKVAVLLHVVAKELMDRADGHDASKLIEPEVSGFNQSQKDWRVSPMALMSIGQGLRLISRSLSITTKGIVTILSSMLMGWHDMTLVDLIEMIVDWEASARRNPRGRAIDVIDMQQKRFNLDDQLTAVIKNTLTWISMRIGRFLDNTRPLICVYIPPILGHTGSKWGYTGSQWDIRYE